MKTNKKIDQIFRDKFRGVETTPPADSWQNIALRLPEKKQRKLLPFWYQLAGAAAAIALIFILFNFNNSNQNNTQISQFNNKTPNRQFNLNITSAAFDEWMSSSSAILSAAVMDTRIEGIKEQYESRTYTKTGINSAKSTNSKSREKVILAGLSEEKEKRSFITKNDTNVISNSERTQPTSVNSGAIATISENEMEEKDLAKIASANKSEKEVKDKEIGLKRFSVTPTAAAVYFDTGKGNALDNQFAGGSGEISMSYGVNLAYQVSDKVKLRSGVNNVNLSFITRNIDYASARNSSGITTQENAIIQTSSVNGSLNQEFSFLEIPVEVEYILIDKKLGLNLIGGASTFFLEENRVSLESPNFTEEIGEANNLNKTSFSANFGLGVNYDISPQFRFNLEPIFKYQINTFNRSSNLSSYYFGIYSGLSFKF